MASLAAVIRGLIDLNQKNTAPAGLRAQPVCIVTYSQHLLEDIL